MKFSNIIVVVSTIGIIATCDGQLSSFSSATCSSSKPNELFLSASSVADEVDKFLVPSLFARVAEGLIVALVDEKDGEDSGGGTNPDGVYSAFLFQSEDILPEGLCDVPNFSGEPRCDPVTGQTASFLLGPADAIAILACSPPPMKYFSYDAYIDVRLTEEFPFYPGQNIGDTISINSINTTTKDVFDQPIVVIHTADGQAGRAVADAFTIQAHMPKSSISVRGIPADTVRLWDRSEGKSWKDTSPDILSIISRITLPLNGSEAAYKSYKYTTWPVRFYFAHDDAVAAEPLNPQLKSRYSDRVNNEFETVGKQLDMLSTAIQGAFGKMSPRAVQKGVLNVNLSATGFYDDWDVVLANKNNNSYVFPDRDAAYGVPIIVTDEQLEIARLYDNTAAVLIGVLHSKSIGAVYNNAGLNLANELTGEIMESHWFMDDELEGSAARYFPESDASVAEFLFAIDFLPPGGCGNRTQWCVEFKKSSMNTFIAQLSLGERIYCINETGVGAAANTTIGASALVFEL